MPVDYDRYLKFHVGEYPVRHRRKDLMKIDVRISLDYRSRIESIRELDSVLGSYLLRLRDYLELVNEVHSVNVHWSTKIEGNKLSLEEVKKSSRQIASANRLLEARDPGFQQEILNHLYSYWLQDLFKLPWTLDTVRRMHSILMYNTGEVAEPGTIRSEEVNVVSGDMQTFIACPAVHVESELGDLLEGMAASPYDPLITSIVFFHEYESIHPFTEGNGRTGRSLFHILVQELGLRNFNLCKVEDKLLGKSAIYYSLMEYTDKTGDYTPLVEYFIDCILMSYQEAETEFGEMDVLKDMDENSRTIALKARRKNDWFSVADAASWVKGLGEQSTRMKLNELISMGILEKEGKTRSTRFRFCDPFRKVKASLSGTIYIDMVMGY